jgi:hypothetical protein
MSSHRSISLERSEDPNDAKRLIGMRSGITKSFPDGKSYVEVTGIAGKSPHEELSIGASSHEIAPRGGGQSWRVLFTAATADVSR